MAREERPMRLLLDALGRHEAELSFDVESEAIPHHGAWKSHRVKPPRHAVLTWYGVTIDPLPPGLVTFDLGKLGQITTLHR